MGRGTQDSGADFGNGCDIRHWNEVDKRSRYGGVKFVEGLHDVFPVLGGRVALL